MLLALLLAFSLLPRPLPAQVQIPNAQLEQVSELQVTRMEAAAVAVASQVSCSNAVARVIWCNEAGSSCVQFQYPCWPFACDGRGSTCASRCSSDAECAAGAACSGVTGQCVPAASRCSDDRTVMTPDGQEHSCGPHHCFAGQCMHVPNRCSDEASVVDADGRKHSCEGYRCFGGECIQRCSTADDCTFGHACDTLSGACLPVR